MFFKLAGPPLVHTGIYRQYDTEGDYEAAFIDNGRFVAVNGAARRAQKRGIFAVHPRPRRPGLYMRGYRTVFGPHIRHNGVVYSRSSHSMGNALYRLFHDKNNQRERMSRQRDQLNCVGLRQWRSLVRAGVDEVAPTEHWTDVVDCEANKPHNKRPLRVQTWDELVERGRFGRISDMYTGREEKGACVRAHLKPDEFGKPGKPGRITIDLGTGSSLRSGFLVDVVKDVWAKRVGHFRGVKVVFVKSPDLSVLTHWFKRMLTESICLFYSDDACVSLRTSEGMLYFNLDISSCDSSNGPAVFESLRELVPDRMQAHLEPVLRQCQLPVEIGYGKEKMVFRPTDYFEYSGSVLTTTLNNTAVSAIIYHILSTYSCADDSQTVRANVQARLDDCGWTCTIEWCDVYEQLQFLKCSPCYTVCGEVRAVLNLGVILRAMGQKTRDLPGRGSLAARIHAFMCGWVAGLRHVGLHPLLETLQGMYPPTGQKFFNSNAIERLESGGVANPRLDVSSLMRRYGATPFHLEELCSALTFTKGECVGICTDLTNKILMLDYGLCCTGDGDCSPVDPYIT